MGVLSALVDKNLNIISVNSQAEVCGQADDENLPEFQLKRYDYFGHGERLIINLMHLCCQ